MLQNKENILFKKLVMKTCKKDKLKKINFRKILTKICFEKKKRIRKTYKELLKMST